MAYYNDEDEKDQLGADAEGGPQQASPQSGAVIDASGGGGAGAKSQAAAKPDRSGNFVGISNYLNANKSQAGKLGDQTAGVINQTKSQAEGDLNNLNRAFNQKAGSAVALDDATLGKVGQAEKLNDEEKQKIKGAYNAQYSGPNSLTDITDSYQKANQSIAKNEENVKAAQTEGGRAGLISQVNAKPRTAGINNFDSLLLQTGQGRQKVEDAASQAKAVNQDVLSQNNLLAQQKAADIKSQTDATREKVQSAVGGAKKSLAENLSQRLKEMQTGAIDKNNAVMNDIGDNAYNLDQSTLDALGIKAGQASYGLNPLDYVTGVDPNSINLQNVANDDDYARSIALAELSGEEGPLSADTRGLAGTAAQGPTFAKDKFAADLAKKQQAFSDLYNKQAVDDIISGAGSDFYSTLNSGVNYVGNMRDHVNSLVKGKTAAQLESLPDQILKDTAFSVYNLLGANNARSQLASNIKDYLKRLKSDSEKTAFKANEV